MEIFPQKHTASENVLFLLTQSRSYNWGRMLQPERWLEWVHINGVATVSFQPWSIFTNSQFASWPSSGSWYWWLKSYMAQGPNTWRTSHSHMKLPKSPQSSSEALLCVPQPSEARRVATSEWPSLSWLWNFGTASPGSFVYLYCCLLPANESFLLFCLTFPHKSYEPFSLFVHFCVLIVLSFCF